MYKGSNQWRGVRLLEEGVCSVRLAAERPPLWPPPPHAPLPHADIVMPPHAESVAAEQRDAVPHAPPPHAEQAPPPQAERLPEQSDCPSCDTRETLPRETLSQPDAMLLSSSPASLASGSMGTPRGAHRAW